MLCGRWGPPVFFFLAGVTVDELFLRTCAPTVAVARSVVGERSMMTVRTEVSVRRPMVAAADWTSPQSWEHSSSRLLASCTTAYGCAI